MDKEGNQTGKQQYGHPIDQYFEWLSIDNKYILEMDSSDLDDTNQDRGMALCHRSPYQYSIMPGDQKDKKRLLINLTNSKVAMKTFYELYSYFKVKSYSDVIAVYGAYSNAVIIALVKAVSPYLKSKARIFKTKEEAIAYLLTF